MQTATTTAKRIGNCCDVGEMVTPHAHGERGGGNTKAAKATAREEEMPMLRGDNGEWWEGVELPCYPCVTENGKV